MPLKILAPLPAKCGSNFDTCSLFSTFGGPWQYLLFSLTASKEFELLCKNYSVIQPQAHGRFRACVWQAFVCYLASFLPAALREAQTCRYLVNSEANFEVFRPAGAYPLHDFHKICRVCTSFQDALGVKLWLDLVKGLWSYGGFKLRGSGFPQIFSAP